MNTLDEAEPDRGRSQGPVPGTELRIALAMRGGVSLAVWIGGAMAELDLARRAMLGDQFADEDVAVKDRAMAYAELIRARGYDGLKIDVLAGASAGGLNAVIYGFAQSVGTDLEWLYDVWRENGDIWELFHPSWRATMPFRTEALLQGDARFYALVLEKLTTDKKLDPRRVTDYLTVDLAATLQAGPPLLSRPDGEDVRPRRAHFRFRRTPATPGGPFNDLPASVGATETDTELIRQLAYAARSTSSFPGAFEPASVVSWPATPSATPRQRADYEVNPATRTPENMTGVFSESSVDSTPAFYVMDGGVFDNIPIGRAIQAIADAPAAAPTRRVLVYLDPSPPARSPAATARVRRLGSGKNRHRKVMRAALVRSTLTAFRYKKTVESATDDLQELRRLQTALDDVQARRQLFIDALPGVLEQSLVGEGPAQRYLEFRCVADANRLVDLMVTPGAGLLRALVPVPRITSALSEAEAANAREDLRCALQERAEQGDLPLKTDATALASTADLFITWIRDLQQDRSASPDLDTAKAALYRIRAAALLVRDRREARALAAVLTQPPNETIKCAVTAGILWPSPLGGGACCPAELDLDEAAFWKRLEEVQQTPGRPPMENDLVVGGWKALCSVINQLGGAPTAGPSPTTPEAPGAGTGTDPGTNPVLRRLAVARLNRGSAQDVGVAASLAVGSLMSSAVPRFYTFTGDEAPLPADPDMGPDCLLPQVTAEGRAMAMDAAVAAGSPGVDDDVVHARSKLAGNQLANFAGFLSVEWRKHDWRWGRADAGAALFRMLEGMPPVSRIDQRRADLALAQARQEVAKLTVDLDRPKYRLSDLTAARRFALGSRTLLGAQRALWPLTPRAFAPPETSRFQGAPAVLVQMLLRPLLVMVPLLLRPAVLAAVLAAVALSEYAGGPHRVGAPVAVSAGILLVLSVAHSQLSLRNLRQRWERLTIPTTWDPPDSPDPISEADKRATIIRRLKRAQLLAALELVALGLVVAAFSSASGPLEDVGQALSRLTDFTVFVALVVIVLLNAGRGSFTAVKLGQRSTRDRAGWGLCAAIAAAMLAWLLLAGPIADASPDTQRIGAVAFATGVLVWAVHHYWAGTWWPPLMGAFSAAFAAAGLAWLQPRQSPPQSPTWETDLDDAALALIDVLLPFVVLAAVYVLAFATKMLAPSDAPSGAGRSTRETITTGIGLILLLAVTMMGTLAIYLSWGWLQGVPLALVLGATAAAATTLVAPFDDIVDAPTG
jgi:patatin-related protein